MVIKIKYIYLLLVDTHTIKYTSDILESLKKRAKLKREVIWTFLLALRTKSSFTKDRYPLKLTCSLIHHQISEPSDNHVTFHHVTPHHNSADEVHYTV